jgi:hypothetical protein
LLWAEWSWQEDDFAAVFTTRSVRLEVALVEGIEVEIPAYSRFFRLRLAFDEPPTSAGIRS